MDSQLTVTILWTLLGIICMSCSQVQVEVNVGKVSCTCVPNHMCKNNSTQVTTGNTAENKYYYEGDIDSITVNITFKQKGLKCPSNLVECCSSTEVTPPPPPNNTSCGNINPEGVDFRLRGYADNESKYGEFPWMVAVLRHSWVIDNTTLKVMECAGSIIHPQVVLTAAHCVKGKHDLYIRAGEWDTHRLEMYPTQERNVKDVITHEDFYERRFHNNIALLVLDQPLELNAVVGTLCLPEQDEIVEGRNCVVSGWGKDTSGKYMTIMKRVEQTVLGHDKCEEKLTETGLPGPYRLHESLICTGGKEGQDVCKGDDGGALACPSKDDSSVYVQVGIVSLGSDCESVESQFYVKVPFFRNWIKEEMNSRNLV